MKLIKHKLKTHYYPTAEEFNILYDSGYQDCHFIGRSPGEVYLLSRNNETDKS